MKSSLSRRSFVAVAALSPLAASAFAGHARRALADEATLAALADAQSRYDALKAQLEELTAQYQQLCVEFNDTLAQIDAKTQQIAAIEGQIAELNAAPAEEGVDNAETVAQLEAQEADLAAQRDGLEALRDQKDAQLAEMKQRQAEVTELLNSADAEVKALTEQRDRELAARAEEEAAEQARKKAQQEAQEKAAQEAKAEEGAALAEAEQKAKEQTDAKAEEEAAAKEKAELYARLTDDTRAELLDMLVAVQANEAYGGTSVAKVIEACRTVPSTGEGWCASWVTEVFVAAGIGRFDGDACDMYAAWCNVADMTQVEPGMIVATPSHNLTNDGQIYGHVGIYVGNGKVVDNVGYIRIKALSDWVKAYGGVIPVRCGWLGGVALVSRGRFYDVDPDAWYADFVTYVSDNSIMHGYDDESGKATGAFGPYDSVSRAQVAAVLCRHALGAAPAGTGEGFYDVDAGAWYAGEVEWCHRSGIVTGEVDENGRQTGYFRPEADVTREQLATMVHRYAKMLGRGTEAGDIGGFPDAADVSAYAAEALAWCYACGIVTGDTTSGEARLNPQSGATRAQLAKIVTVLVRDVL